MAEIKIVYDPRWRERVPPGFCPDCTKDLDADGWCFECRKYASEKMPPCSEGDAKGDTCADPACPAHGESDHNLMTDEQAEAEGL